MHPASARTGAVTLAALTHGWSGLAMGYAAVQLPLLAGLARGRASMRHYWFSPALAVPLTVATGIGLAFARPWIHALDPGSLGVLPFVFGTAASVAIGYGTGRIVAAGSDEDTLHRRGTLLRSAPAEPRHRAGKHATTVRGAAVTLAGIPVPAQDEAKHFKLIGTTGTGKSTAIRELLRGALARGDRAVIADPDAGYIGRFYRPERGDVVLNPFEPRSVRWDLFAEIESPHDVEQLARSLIPDHDGADRSWRGYARTFLAALIRQAHETGVRDVGELYRLLVASDVAELRILTRGTPAQPFLDEHNLRMFDSIRSVAASAVDSLQYVAEQDAKEFSIRHWVRSDTPGVLFLPYKAGQIAALRSTISAWMRLAIFETMDRPEAEIDKPNGDRRRLWFVVDELDALGQIDGLKDALARLRKFDGRCVLGFQSVAQVSSTYGAGDAHTIVENCGNTLILRCSASEGGGTARFASQLVGDREVMRTTVSTSSRSTEIFGSRTHSQQIIREPALLPSEIEQLPDLTGYLKHASKAVWQRVSLSPSASQRLPAAADAATKLVRVAALAQTVEKGVRHADHGFDYD